MEMTAKGWSMTMVTRSENHELASTFLTATASLVETFLSQTMDRRDKAPPRLIAAMRHTLEAGGKRIRPALCLAAAEVVGGCADDALPAACAIEMLHTYSLIHDDLPAMDNDDFRRGRPTCHVAFDEATAILAGDGLLTDAFSLMTESPRDSVRVLLAVRELAGAAGSQGMVGGQQLDLEGAGKPVGLADVERIHAGKTAALLGASAAIGSILGGGSVEAVASLRCYGIALGMAFQAMDDVLDTTASREVLGKTPGKDQSRQMPTLVRALGVDGTRRWAEDWSRQALEALEPVANRPAAAILRGFVALCMSRNH
jgi:geranylgeranyl pyrophosphate synthase